MKLFKRVVIALLMQMLCLASLMGQKYQNGTKLLKGAEVLSGTPLQLDYILETLADTAKITVNLHEGKTHLVLDDGSSLWREWWYYMGRWQAKAKDGALPAGKDGSIQTKSGKAFAGSNLGIKQGFIYSLDETPSDVGINHKNATVRLTSQSQAVVEAGKTDSKGVTTSNVVVGTLDISLISQKYDKGALLKADTSNLAHWRTKQTGNDFWNFISSLPDTTFYIKKRMKFDQPNTSVYVKNGNLRLSDKTGDYALSDLNGASETDPVWTSVQGGYFTKTNLQTPGGSQVHWNNITNKPTTAGNYGIKDVYTKTETHALIGDTANVLRQLIKNKTVTESDPTVPAHVKSITTTNVTNWNTAYTNSHTHSNKTVLDGITATNITNWNTAFGWGNHATQGYLKAESDPVWTAASANYYSKSNLQTSGGASVHWDNITDKPAMGGTGSVTSVGLSLPAMFTVTGSPVSSAGTLSATLASQTKNMVFAAPATANGTPTFRALQETDLPNINWSKIYNTPPTLAEHGISNAYTKTETNALFDIAGNDYQLLMLSNKRPAVIPRTSVSNQPTHTQITFGGYEKTWEYPDIRIPASIMADATGFNFSGSWLNYRTNIETRSGNLTFDVSDLDDNNFQSSFRMNHYGISQNATNIYWDTKQGYNLMVQDGDNKNEFWTTLTQTKNEIRKKAGNYIYHTNFQIGDGSLLLSSGIEENNIVRPTGSFYVAQKYMKFDRYYSYSAFDTTMRVLNAVDLYSYDEPKVGYINVTGDNDIRFGSKATREQTETGSITLTEIIQKGQIFKQSEEPSIPDDSFAFWVCENDFYIVLRSNNVQKKIQLQ